MQVRLNRFSERASKNIEKKNLGPQMAAQANSVLAEEE